MPYAPPGTCGICNGDPVRRRFVDKELALGTPHTQIERKSRDLHINVKRETIRRHVKVCINGAVLAIFDQPEAAPSSVPSEAASPALPAVVDPIPPLAPRPALNGDDSRDFAQLVRAEALRRLDAGELNVGTRDGLHAQELIDRRVEKAKDRQLAVVLGQLLSGYASPKVPVVVEGEYVETTDDKVMLHLEGG